MNDDQYVTISQTIYNSVVLTAIIRQTISSTLNGCYWHVSLSGMDRESMFMHEHVVYIITLLVCDKHC